eukprot:CAMPEP_0115022058 /NCGR_PEP_ID=MMETSP0216-20121206/31286_1 /TAXON_ID=223996 /ORGANISM="Protocruzia adherens, Strain Boccale" /LENGTH=1203 /DNA_ID=CAMNT_0002394593 /DNA_START=48 /DNA_END=3659 /DNA_ORIENTATION=-
MTEAPHDTKPSAVHGKGHSMGHGVGDNPIEDANLQDPYFESFDPLGTNDSFMPANDFREMMFSSATKEATNKKIEEFKSNNKKTTGAKNVDPAKYSKKKRPTKKGKAAASAESKSKGQADAASNANSAKTAGGDNKAVNYSGFPSTNASSLNGGDDSPGSSLSNFNGNPNNPNAYMSQMNAMSASAVSSAMVSAKGSKMSGPMDPRYRGIVNQDYQQDGGEMGGNFSPRVGGGGGTPSSGSNGYAANMMAQGSMSAGGGLKRRIPNEAMQMNREAKRRKGDAMMAGLDSYNAMTGPGGNGAPGGSVGMMAGYGSNASSGMEGKVRGYNPMAAEGMNQYRNKDASFMKSMLEADTTMTGRQYPSNMHNMKKGGEMMGASYGRGPRPEYGMSSSGSGQMYKTEEKPDRPDYYGGSGSGPGGESNDRDSTLDYLLPMMRKFDSLESSQKDLLHLFAKSQPEIYSKAMHLIFCEKNSSESSSGPSGVGGSGVGTPTMGNASGQYSQMRPSGGNPNVNPRGSAGHGGEPKGVFNSMGSSSNPGSSSSVNNPQNGSMGPAGFDPKWVESTRAYPSGGSAGGNGPRAVMMGNKAATSGGMPTTSMGANASKGETAKKRASIASMGGGGSSGITDSPSLGGGSGGGQDGPSGANAAYSRKMAGMAGGPMGGSYGPSGGNSMSMNPQMMKMGPGKEGGDPGNYPQHYNYMYGQGKYMSSPYYRPVNYGQNPQTFIVSKSSNAQASKNAGGQGVTAEGKPSQASSGKGVKKEPGEGKGGKKGGGKKAAVKIEPDSKAASGGGKGSKNVSSAEASRQMDMSGYPAGGGSNMAGFGMGMPQRGYMMQEGMRGGPSTGWPGAAGGAGKQQAYRGGRMPGGGGGGEKNQPFFIETNPGDKSTSASSNPGGSNIDLSSDFYDVKNEGFYTDPQMSQGEFPTTNKEFWDYDNTTEQFFDTYSPGGNNSPGRSGSEVTFGGGEQNSPRSSPNMTTSSLITTAKGLPQSSGGPGGKQEGQGPAGGVPMRNNSAGSGAGSVSGGQGPGGMGGSMNSSSGMGGHGYGGSGYDSGMYPGGSGRQVMGYGGNYPYKMSQMGQMGQMGMYGSNMYPGMAYSGAAQGGQGYPQKTGGSGAPTANSPRVAGGTGRARKNEGASRRKKPANSGAKGGGGSAAANAAKNSSPMNTSAAMSSSQTTKTLDPADQFMDTVGETHTDPNDDFR